MYFRLSSWSELYCPWIWCTLIFNIVILPVDTGRCRFTHTWHTFQWRLWWLVDEIIQTLIWNIYLQDIKLIFHMTYKQREMNSLPVILTYFMQGGEKCIFFAITSLLIQLWIAQFQNEKKNDTLLRYMYQESALSMIISLKHFLFCAELKIKLTTTYNPIQTKLVMNVVYCFKNKNSFWIHIKKTKVLKNHWILNISLTYGYMQSICVILKMFVISARIVETLHVHVSFLSGGWCWGYMYMHRRTRNKIWILWWTKTNFSLRTGKSGYIHDE